jgi:mannosyl-oligosaccharide alpha-1,3-glucosidase
VTIQALEQTLDRVAIFVKDNVGVSNVTVTQIHDECWRSTISVAMRSCGFTALIFCLLFTEVFSVKSGDFKTCSQSGFCRRGRALAARAKEDSSWKSPYAVDPSSIVASRDNASFMAMVTSSVYPEIKFGLELRLHQDGVVRVRMDELGGLRKRYDEAASWALISEPEVDRKLRWSIGKQNARVAYGIKQNTEVVVSFDPLTVSLYRNGKVQVVLNGQGLLHMEHFRNKETPEVATESDGDQTVMKVNPNAWFEGDSEDAWWEESFLSWTDSKPKGS